MAWAVDLEKPTARRGIERKADLPWLRMTLTTVAEAPSGSGRQVDRVPHVV